MTSILKVDTIQDQDGNNIINENAGTITIGKSGDTVQVAAGAEFVGGGTQWQSTIVTGTTLSAVAGNGYWIDTTSNACTVTLPASASVGDTIEFSDYARTWGTNAVTLNPNSLNFQGNTSPNPQYNTSGQSVRIVYSGATQGWIPTSDDDVTLETPQTYSAEYLVVAGGGSGGSTSAGGGGGAGGFLTNYGTSTITLSSGTTYTATVGAGGASVNTNVGNDGNDSVLSGTGISTVTAIGGGGGGGIDDVPSFTGGRDGGSGGGGARESGTGSEGLGTVGQGNDGGIGLTGGGEEPYYPGGGGGGASADGADSDASGGGDGGNGLSNSITGSAVTYAGGGGGGVAVSGGTPGSGGSGGGGTAGTFTGAGNAGTANTGGGGGGCSGAGQDSGAGGSGVVILRVPTANYSGSTTGSPTVTTDGTDTVIKFTGSGTYIA